MKTIRIKDDTHRLLRNVKDRGGLASLDEAVRALTTPSMPGTPAYRKEYWHGVVADLLRDERAAAFQDTRGPQL